MKKWFLVISVWMLLCGSIFAQDREKGVNDPDFFPIAVWAQNPVNASAYKENGINMFISIHGGLDQEKLDHMKKADMKVIAHQNNFGLTKLDEPLIYGWMHGDEPDNAQRSKTENKWDPCRDPAVIVSDYEKIKKNDPTRPVYLNVGRGVAYTNWVGRGVCRGKTDMYKVSNNGYLKGCDIASFDIYPVNAREDDVEGQLWYVAKGIDNLQEWSDNKKPTWCWIETTRIGEKAKRKPTPAEVKSEVWMALIHGAKGFGYFCHSFIGKTDDAALLHDAEMIQGVKEINEQVTSLAAVLNSPDTEYAAVHSSNQSVPVDILTKKQDKANYIFAVAMREGRTTATFEVKSGKTVAVLGENRTLKIKKGKFSDEFSGYGVHLYRITK
ncbi:MAG: hypothetical protein WD824_21800 [Cyclobacteriaceae bacterium]